MKAKDYREELREKNISDLLKEELELKEQLFKLRFKHATRHVDNPHELANIKRNIARVKTVIREKELALQKK